MTADIVVPGYTEPIVNVDPYKITAYFRKRTATAVRTDHGWHLGWLDKDAKRRPSRWLSVDSRADAIRLVVAAVMRPRTRGLVPTALPAGDNPSPRSG